jgi:hypothetical protein
MGGSVQIPLDAKYIADLLDEMEHRMARSWAVYVTFRYDQNKWVVGKIVPWRGRFTVITRYPDDIHRVEASDELGAFAIMKRTLDKLGPP